VVAARWVPASLFALYGAPEASPWSEDDLGAPDTVLDRVGQRPFEACDWAGKIADAPQKALGAALGYMTRDALTSSGRDVDNPNVLPVRLGPTSQSYK
jgi:hypothetical protein